MSLISVVEKLFTQHHDSPHKGESVIQETLDIVRLLRSAGSALSAQAALHGQLAKIEWEEEKSRIIQMIALLLAGFALGICLLMFVGLLVVAACWDTPYRFHSIFGVIVVYILAIAAGWFRIQTLRARSSRAFAATREELAADIALIRSKI